MNFMKIKELMIKTHQSIMAILEIEKQLAEAYKNVECKRETGDDSQKES